MRVLEIIPVDVFAENQIRSPPFIINNLSIIIAQNDLFCNRKRQLLFIILFILNIIDKILTNVFLYCIIMLNIYVKIKNMKGILLWQT